MKIAIITTNFPRWAGDFRVPFIIDAAKALQAKGHTVRIITLHQPGSAEHEVIDGLEIFRMKYSPEKYEVLQADAAGIPSAWDKGLIYKLALLPFFGALCLGAAKYAKGHDIIHANWALAGLAAHLTRPQHHCPYVVTIHGSDIFKTAGNPLLRLPVRIALKNAGHIIAVSEALAHAGQGFGIPSDRIRVIPTGIDIRKFPYAGPENRENLLLYVGSLIERKGVIHLLRAMQKVKVKWPDYKLLIVGEGILWEELETYVRENGLQDHVGFLGPQSQAEVAGLMRRSKLFILPSTEEGQGAVLVEAMASGTPCIGSNTGGIPNVITGDVGRVFAPTNSDELFNAITAMLENETVWQKASQNARIRAVDHYSWDLLAESIIGLYQSVLGRESR
jgi:glycosyltransferase involved in cell wall biosynthesis